MNRTRALVASVLLGLAALAGALSTDAIAQWVQGPAAPYNAIRDGLTPTFDYVGADPTVSPGYDLPIGSIVRYGSSTGIPFYYEKVGYGRTEWSIVQGHAAGTAGWPLLTSGSTNVRFFCVDYGSGSDKRRGYVDAAAGSTLTTCSTVAVKTLKKVRELIPPHGNGRSAVVLIKPRTSGATYRNAGDTADEGLDLTGISGYAYFGVRGSDLTNSTTDRTFLGAMVAVSGPGTGGLYTLAGAPTVQTFSIAAGSLGATDTSVGYRWRFDTATTTAALRGIGCFVSVNSTTAATCGIDLPATPVAGGTPDTGYLERPGLRVATLKVPVYQDVNLAGIAVTSSAYNAFDFSTAAYVHASFLESTATTSNASMVAYPPYSGVISVSRSYSDEAGTARTSGCGMRSGGIFEVSALWAFISSSAFLNTSGTGSVLDAVGALIGDGGSYFAGGMELAAHSGEQYAQVASATANRAARVIGNPLTLHGSWKVSKVQVSSSPTSGIILGTSFQPQVRVSLATVTGTSNTTFGIDGAATTGAQITIASDCTITGASGDLKLAGPATATIADLSLSNVVDVAGNDWRGATRGSIVGQASLVTNKAGSALAVGNVVRDNGTSGQVTTAQADTSAHATGALCAMVTAPANNADGYEVCSGVPYVLYDGAPTMGALSYLSPGTAGKLTSTIPAASVTNQKLRFSHPSSTSGNTARVPWFHELVPVLSDGAL